MKAKIKRGSGSRGALNYVYGKDQAVEYIGGNMSGADPRSLAAEFALSRQQRPDVQRPVWHCSLSLPKGENLDNQKWAEIAEDFVSRLGFTDQHQYTVVKHTDTDHEHIHIVASRIGLDGSLYYGKNENLKATRLTQEFEKKYGLQQTPGPEYDEETGKIKMPATAQLKKNEIEMALRAEQAPPKLKLQRIINEAKQDHPEAPEFMERLFVAGVNVRVNVARTGRMNGFSFEVDGISFKASQLGKAYSWKQLQKEVIYEQDRHGEAIRRLNATVASSSAAPGTEQPVERIENSEQTITGSDSGTVSPSLKSGQSDKRSIEDSANNDRSDLESYKIRTGKTLEDGESTDNIAGQNSSSQLGIEARKGSLEKGNNQVAGGIREVSQGKSENFDIVRTDNKFIDGIAGSRGVNMAWNTRFKIASANRRKSKELGNTDAKHQPVKQRSNNGYYTKEQIAEVKQIDPAPLFNSYGFEVKKDGQHHLSICLDGDEYYRSSYKDGKWLHTRKEMGDGVGDNIDLVKELSGNPSMPFIEAVYQLYGSAKLDISSPGPQLYRKEKLDRPRLPFETKRAISEGREYLRNRGISDETVDWGEGTGFIHYVGGGVCFIGYANDFEVRLVNKRLVNPSPDEPKKRDLAGSDKTYCPILFSVGEDRKAELGNEMWIVESGIDALALHDICRRHDKQDLPTVITTGGNNFKFINNEVLQEYFKNVEKVTVCYENDKDPETQAKTDKTHDRQIELIKQLNENVEKYKPVSEFKDLADQNFGEGREEIKRKKETKQSLGGLKLEM